MRLISQSTRFDKTFVFLILGLVVFGILAVFEASAPDAVRQFGDKFFYVKRQALWAGIGLIFFVFAARIKYTFWQKAALPLFLLTVILLTIVFIPGVGISALGASRRIDIGPVALQPAELAKLAIIVFLAKTLQSSPSFFRFIIPVGIIGGLVVAEPDLGTAVVLVATSFLLYFASGVNVFQFIGVGALAVLGAIVLAMSSEYRKERILTFLNPAYDPQSVSYHVRQILIAVGSGGLFGVGLGNSRQKYLFLPEPATDSIFAIIAEEMGFIGAVSLIAAFAFLIIKGLKVAQKTQDPFGRLLAVGITGWIGIQTFVNIGAMVAILPLTGIPLPLISYGGSSLIVTMVALGILANIASYAPQKER